MANNTLSEKTKELRKKECLSQDELANKSGLSLRTIQRIEKGESKPSGDTLKRIALALNVSTKDLLSWDLKTSNLKESIKLKHEYLHIFNDKLVISKTAEIDDLVKDYSKSVNDFFKTLAVHFIFVTIFSIITVALYFNELHEFAFSSANIALFFMLFAFYQMLSSSGISLIQDTDIHKIKLNSMVIKILYYDAGRIKQRGILLQRNQAKNIKNILLSHNLIKQKDINLKGYILILPVITGSMIPLFSPMLDNNAYYTLGFFIMAYNIFLIFLLLKDLLYPILVKQNMTKSAKVK